MKINLMLTCLADAYYGDVGIGTVKVLKALGHEVGFPKDQTCCGQPPFNAGDWPAAKKIVEHTKQVFSLDSENPIRVVVPSGSCTSMMREGYVLLGEAKPPVPAMEFGEFLMSQMGDKPWPWELKPEMKIAFHRSCHTRGLHLATTIEDLLSTVNGLSMIPFVQADQCCGFGGAFSATHGKISAEIGLEKLRNVVAAGATTLVSGDMGCLMHLNGLIERENLKLKTMHLAELLALTLPEQNGN